MNNERASTNFLYSEFDSKDGSPMPADVKKNIKKLAGYLEIIRAALGVRIKISSGYRSPAHNSKIGGAKNSQHIKGRAADIQTKLPTSKVKEVIEQLIQEKKIPEGGVGLYSTWVHYHYGGKKARWNG
jgi:uncharacterized protein YcbK (DUF882 family)